MNEVNVRTTIRCALFVQVKSHRLKLSDSFSLKSVPSSYDI